MFVNVFASLRAHICSWKSLALKSTGAVLWVMVPPRGKLEKTKIATEKTATLTKLLKFGPGCLTVRNLECVLHLKRKRREKKPPKQQNPKPSKETTQLYVDIWFCHRIQSIL